MRIIELTNAHRKKHFDLFQGMNHPHFGVCAPVEVGPWLRLVKARRLRVTPSLVYLLARCANDIPELRQRIRGDQIVEHDLVHPSFATSTEETDVFSFCQVDFTWDLEEFVARSEEQMALMRHSPSLEDDPGRDDYLFMSAFPWVAFTAVQHPMAFHPCDSVPRITWGKLVDEAGRVTMPISFQAHHAVVDGIHAGRFFQRVEAVAADPERWL